MSVDSWAQLAAERPELKSQADGLQLLLADEKSWDQAIELLVGLNDPDVWRALAEMFPRVRGEAGMVLRGRALRLLSRLPRDQPIIRERCLDIGEVDLGHGTDLDASLTPNVERVTASYFKPTRPVWLSELRRLPRLTRLQLENVRIDDASTLNLPGLQCLQLTQTHVDLHDHHVKELAVLPALRALELTTLSHRVPTQPALQSLRLHWSSSELSLYEQPLLYSPHTSLTITTWAGRDLEPLTPYLRSIEELELGSKSLSTISTLEYATSLRQLTIRNARIEDLGVLRSIPTLEKLTLLFASKLQSLDSISGHPALRSINLNGCEAIESLEPLTTLPRLEEIVSSWPTDRVPESLRDRIRRGRVD